MRLVSSTERGSPLGPLYLAGLKVTKWLRELNSSQHLPLQTLYQGFSSPPQVVGEPDGSVELDAQHLLVSRVDTVKPYLGLLD